MKYVTDVTPSTRIDAAASPMSELYERDDGENDGEQTAQRNTLFTGETLKGLLLTSYGFSVFGEKAAQFATVAYIAAGLLLLLAIAGLIHALITPRSKGFGVPEPTETKREKVTA